MVVSTDTLLNMPHLIREPGRRDNLTRKQTETGAVQIRLKMRERHSLYSYGSSSRLNLVDRGSIYDSHLVGYFRE